MSSLLAGACLVHRGALKEGRKEKKSCRQGSTPDRRCRVCCFRRIIGSKYLNFHQLKIVLSFSPPSLLPQSLRHSHNPLLDGTDIHASYASLHSYACLPTYMSLPSYPRFYPSHPSYPSCLFLPIFPSYPSFLYTHKHTLSHTSAERGVERYKRIMLSVSRPLSRTFARPFAQACSVSLSLSLSPPPPPNPHLFPPPPPLTVLLRTI